MRFVMESHARTHYSIDMFTANSLAKICECYSIPVISEKRIEKDINIVNELSHGMSFIEDSAKHLDARSVQQVIRDLIAVLYHKDPYHVKALLAADDVHQWSEVNLRLQEWAGTIFPNDDKSASVAVAISTQGTRNNRLGLEGKELIEILRTDDPKIIADAVKYSREIHKERPSMKKNELVESVQAWFKQ